MKYVLILLLFDQVHHYAFGTTPDPSQFESCVQAASNLSTDEQHCFTVTDSSDGTSTTTYTAAGILSPSVLGGVCANRFCTDVLTKLLENCKVPIS